MTPAQSFAQSRANAENLIRRYAPAHLQDAVIEKLLPAIALTAKRADDDEIAVGASKLGGAPDVPAGFEWPRRKPIPFGHLKGKETPLNFIAQLDLAELAPFDIESKLPCSGVLSFFYANSEEGGWPSGNRGEEDGWRVFHFETELTRATTPKGDQEQKPIRSAMISFSPHWSPSPHVYWENRPLSREEDENWFELIKYLKPESPHLIFGYPTSIQGDPRDDAAETLNPGELNEMEDWQLLLQVNTDDEIDFSWHDMGAIFHLLHRDDLASRAWDKCWLIAQCS